VIKEAQGREVATRTALEVGVTGVGLVIGGPFGALVAAAVKPPPAGLALGTDGPALTMIVGVAGTGTFALALAGGLLGHRVTAAMPPPAGGCAGCSCRGGSCGAG
jgi:hypothetical protein